MTQTPEYYSPADAVADAGAVATEALHSNSTVAFGPRNGRLLESKATDVRNTFQPPLDLGYSSMQGVKEVKANFKYASNIAKTLDAQRVAEATEAEESPAEPVAEDGLNLDTLMKNPSAEQVVEQEQDPQLSEEAIAGVVAAVFGSRKPYMRYAIQQVNTSQADTAQKEPFWEHLAKRLGLSNNGVPVEAIPMRPDGKVTWADRRRMSGKPPIGSILRFKGGAGIGKKILDTVLSKSAEIVKSVPKKAIRHANGPDANSALGLITWPVAYSIEHPIKAVAGFAMTALFVAAMATQTFTPGQFHEKVMAAHNQASYVQACEEIFSVNGNKESQACGTTENLDTLKTMLAENTFDEDSGQTAAKRDVAESELRRLKNLPDAKAPESGWQVFKDDMNEILRVSEAQLRLKISEFHARLAEQSAGQQKGNNPTPNG